MSPPLARRSHWALFTSPRQTVFTRMWSGAYSLASDLVRLIPAARVTLVGRERATGTFPPTVVTLTIRPPPRFFIWGMTRRQKRTAAMSLTSMSAAHVASSTFSNGPADEVPALLTRMSTPPCAASDAFTTAYTLVGRATPEVLS